jgi:predicted peroxiredoxin
VKVFIAGSSAILINARGMEAVRRVLSDELPEGVRVVYVMGGYAFYSFVEGFIRSRMIVADVVYVKIGRTDWVHFGPLEYIRDCDRVLCFYPLWSRSKKTDVPFTSAFYSFNNGKDVRLFLVRDNVVVVFTPVSRVVV